MGFGVQPGPRCGHMIGLFRPISKEMVEYLTPETMVEVANRLKEKNIFLAFLLRCIWIRQARMWIGSWKRWKKSANHQQAPCCALHVFLGVCMLHYTIQVIVLQIAPRP